MEPSALQILEREFEAISKDLVERYDALGMRSSGKWANSLEIEVSGNEKRLNAKITGLNYTEQLGFGRKPGKFPPIDAIKQWILDKPITFIESEISISSLAYLIARKIASEGTNYYQQGGTDLIQSVITPKRIQSILNATGNSYIQPIVSGLLTRLKEIPSTKI